MESRFIRNCGQLAKSKTFRNTSEDMPGKTTIGEGILAMGVICELLEACEDFNMQLDHIYTTASNDVARIVIGVAMSTREAFYPDLDSAVLCDLFTLAWSCLRRLSWTNGQENVPTWFSVQLHMYIRSFGGLKDVKNIVVTNNIGIVLLHAFQTIDRFGEPFTQKQRSRLLRDTTAILAATSRFGDPCFYTGIDEPEVLGKLHFPSLLGTIVMQQIHATATRASPTVGDLSFHDYEQMFLLLETFIHLLGKRAMKLSGIRIYSCKYGPRVSMRDAIYAKGSQYVLRENEVMGCPFFEEMDLR